MNPLPLGKWRKGRRATRDQLRRRCEQALAALDLPGDSDLPMLCAHLSRERGLPIRLLPVPLHTEQFYGAWISSKVADFILYEAHTSKPHQQHIIAHEIGHMICGHGTSENLDDVFAGMLFPDIDRSLVRDMLKRGGYSDVQEQEAEITASVILERINRRPRETTWAVPAEAADTIARIERSLVQGLSDPDTPESR